MSRNAPRWLPWLLFAVVAGCYLPSARYGFLYDDFEIILMQEPARSLGDVARMFGEPHGLPLSQMPHYRAPTRATLLVQKGLHGDRPGPFHVFNALLMGAAALAAYSVLRHRRFELPAQAAALGAAAFALHPVASSSVYPICSGRETLLPATFALLAVAAWLRGGLAGRAAGTGAFAVALLGKEAGLVVPLLFAAADALHLTPDPPGRSVRAWAARFVPSLAVVVAYFALRAVVFDPPPAGESVEPLRILREHLARNPLGPLYSLLYALQVLFAPFSRVVYEPPLAVWLDPRRLAFALLAFGALLVAAARLPQRDRAPAVFWLAWLPLGMLLTLNLLPQEASFAERFVLLSALGPIALVTTVVVRASQGSIRSRRLAAAVATAAIALLGVLSLERGRDYRDDLAFTSRWVQTNPRQPNARYSLGAVLARRGRTADAMAEFREALRLEPALAPAHYNLAVLLADQGRREEAIAELRRALRYDPEDAAAHAALAALLEAAGRGDEVAPHHHAPERLAPGPP